MTNPWTSAAAVAAAGPVDEWAPTPLDPVGELVLPDDAPAAGERVYPSLEQWVSRWLARTYRRPVKTQHRAWCPDWWRHPEPVARLQEMWGTWEAAQALGDTPAGAHARSDWWLAADLHMDRLFDTAGPFAGCSTERGHQPGALPALEVSDPHDGWDDEPADQAPGADPVPG